MWRTGCGLAQGPQHIELDVPCQDYCLVETINAEGREPLCVFVVADGAGNPKFRHTQRGSRFVCKFLFKQIQKQYQAGADIGAFTEQNFKDQLFRLFSVLDRFCRVSSLDVIPHDFSATCTLGIVGLNGAVFMQVGDGGIIYRVAGQEQFNVAISPADHRGEYNNQTYMATQEHSYRYASHVVVQEPISEVSAFSDGLIEFLMNINDGIANTDYLSGFFGWVQSENFTSDELSEIITNTLVDPEALASAGGDDKSLVLVYREQETMIDG